MEDNFLEDESGFFSKMIESNRERIDYEIDDDYLINVFLIMMVI